MGVLRYSKAKHLSFSSRRTVTATVHSSTIFQARILSWRSSARSLHAEVGPWTQRRWLISRGEWSSASSSDVVWAASFFVFGSTLSATTAAQRWFAFGPLNLYRGSSSAKGSAWWRWG